MFMHLVYSLQQLPLFNMKANYLLTHCSRKEQKNNNDCYFMNKKCTRKETQIPFYIYTHMTHLYVILKISILMLQKILSANLEITRENKWLRAKQNLKCWYPFNQISNTSIKCINLFSLDNSLLCCVPFKVGEQINTFKHRGLQVTSLTRAATEIVLKLFALVSL